MGCITLPRQPNNNRIEFLGPVFHAKVIVAFEFLSRIRQNLDLAQRQSPFLRAGNLLNSFNTGGV